MVLIRIDVHASCDKQDLQTINIGRAGTYGVQRVEFDLHALPFDVQRVELCYQTPKEFRQMDLPITGTIATWNVSEEDTEYPGSGECELFVYHGIGLWKSGIYPVVVLRNIDS